MKILIVTIVTFISLKSYTCLAAGKCTANELAATQRRVIRANLAKAANPWEKLRDAFKGSRVCMYTYEAADFGEAVRQLLMNRWDKLNGLDRFRKEDKTFYEFVISALTDESAPIQHTTIIHRLAETKCPSGLEVMCKEIVAVTKTIN